MFTIDIIPWLPLPWSSVATPSHSSSLALPLNGINDAVTVLTTGKVEFRKRFLICQPAPNTVHIQMGMRDEIYFQTCWLWQLHVSLLPCGSCGQRNMVHKLWHKIATLWIKMRMKYIFNLVGYGNYTYHCHLVWCGGKQSGILLCAATHHTVKSTSVHWYY